ncbi:MAG: hydrogenobyrinic acid a,c-diamide synthase (glutamine-hydrolyzing) [Thermodesulfovibrionales bacterium]
MRALVSRGLRVTPFKKGPDYIDAGWLASAAGRPCYNLDPFLVGEDRLTASFAAHSEGSQVAVIEGNRGVFDGMDAAGSMSTALVARVLKSPVLLILDCSKATRTLAAVLRGVEGFEGGLRLAGVVLNQIAGARHEAVIRESIGRYCRTPVVGAIPRLRGRELPERHMGLTPWQEHPEVEAAISQTAEAMEKYLDIEGILAAARRAPALAPPAPAPLPPRTGAGLRVGVIRDSAFQFYYPENFEELERRGASVVDISALADRALPDIDALYIGGGFPETHAIALSRNEAFRRSLRRAVAKGLPVYAECGGLMYLGRSLVVDDAEYPMAGVFPVTFRLHRRPQAHGYTVVRVAGKNPFYRKGTVLRGHEFHYSRALEEALPRGTEAVFAMERGAGVFEGADGLLTRSVLATYTHLHALGSPEWAEGVIRAARAYRRARRRPA